MNEVLQFLQNPFYVILGLAILAVILMLICILPYQAYRRGHGFFTWLFLQLLSSNPSYLLVLVANLPNKAKIRKRQQYVAEIDEKLAALRNA